MGDAGQRVQGFLAKLGLTRCYVLVNAYAYALLPSKAPEARALLESPDHLSWRNQLYDMSPARQLEAIVAFGAEARAALGCGRRARTSPSSGSRIRAAATARGWSPSGGRRSPRCARPSPRIPTATRPCPTTARAFTRATTRAIPPGDLPFGMPAWFGDDAWGRTAKPRHNNSVERPGSDLRHTLVWRAPRNQP